ncbi:hypothetical protein N431DRAFT_490869 [Stipitochalara longipes BDJ]|nr:hypothetical protein N431DRAFT_490869 [Stipitochalara longipes BDJ]
MAAMSPAAQDRLFIFGLGLATFAVVGVMRQMLAYYRDTAVVSPPENKPQYITQEVEDSLKLSTLDKLLDSPNFCIQETTAIIICERALHDGPTIDVLLWYITRPDHRLREKGIRALTMMMNSSTVKMIERPDTYAALVKCLEYCVKDYPHNEFDPDWDNWTLRDVVEQGCLLILIQLVDKFGPEGLVKARFVERWLAKEPWGDKEDTNLSLNFATALRKGNRLSQLLDPLFSDPVGRKQMIKAKLVPPALETDLSLLEEGDVKMVDGEGTAGEDFDGMFVESRRRRDQTSEEEHMRRRHREAMVLNDGTRPLGRSDIIQRER